MDPKAENTTTRDPCPEAKKVRRGMNPEARATATLQRRLDLCDAAKALATARRLRDINPKDLTGHLQILIENRVVIPCGVQGKIAVAEAARLMETPDVAAGKSDAAKQAITDFSKMHDLSDRMPPKAFDPFAPLWRDVVHAGLERDKQVKAENPDVTDTDELDGITDWQAVRCSDRRFCRINVRCCVSLVTCTLFCCSVWKQSQALGKAYIESFATDGFLTFMDKGKPEALLTAARAVLGNSEQDNSEDLPESFTASVARVQTVCRALICLLDPEPLAYNSTVKDILGLARYVGNADLESCFRDNMKQKAWKEKYEEAQATASASKLWAPELQQKCAAVQAMWDRWEKEDADPQLDEALDFAVKVLKVRQDMVPNLRQGACHRLDKAFLPLLMGISSDITSRKELDQHLATQVPIAADASYSYIISI